jgi:membrane protease YdiL (CAAX protease family)
MKSVLRFGDRRPLIFVLAVLVAWLMLVSVISILVGTLFDKPIADPQIQAAGTLIATILLLFGAYRVGWIDRIGLVSFGTRSSWVVTLIVAIYVLLVNFYAFFGEFTFQIGALISPDALPILLQALRAGFVEEVVFRGIILYWLVSVWGKSNRGLFAALVVQAALFGALHALQVLGGATPASAISNVLATFTFGLWIGALVVFTGSLWPAMLLHAVSNSFTLIKGLSSQWVTPYFLGYLRESLFELPLVLLGLWLVLKLKANAQRGSEELSKPIVNRSAASRGAPEES